MIRTRQAQGTNNVVALEEYPVPDAIAWTCRIVVLGASVARVVESLGEWVYDEVAAGWNVVIPVAQSVDNRPLRILGAETPPLETFLNAPGSRNRARTVIAADEFPVDERVAAYVAKASSDALVDLRYWPRENSDPLGEALPVVAQESSRAARAFKAHALMALSGTSGAVPRRVG